MKIPPLKRKDLLVLPVRKWDLITEYTTILLVPAGQKHDSGWGLIAIVGCEKDVPKEIAAYCDDVCWNFPHDHPYNYIGEPGYSHHPLRTDCHFPSGIMRFWGSSEQYFQAFFRVGASLSSTDITLIIKGTRENPYVA